MSTVLYLNRETDEHSFILKEKRKMTMVLYSKRERVEYSFRFKQSEEVS